MQRYFLEEPFTATGQGKITGDDAKHISRVMRMNPGDRLIAVYDSLAYESVILEMELDSVRIQQEGNPLRSNEMPVSVTVACGLPKGDKLELIVQKGTELGMAELIPLTAERSVVKWDEKKGGKKTERLRKIAKEAAEQCHRSVIPTIQEPISLPHLLQNLEKWDVLFVADEEDAKTDRPHRIADHLKNVYHKQSILIVFGPEGGLSRSEVSRLQDAGFLPVSLGPRILRAETAPLYFLSALSCEFE